MGLELRLEILEQTLADIKQVWIKGRNIKMD